LRDRAAESERSFGARERGDEAAAAGDRSRKRAEVEAGDDGEGAEGADEKLVEVVAGDIFDDAAAALAEFAGAVDEFRADEEIARGAVELAQRRVDAGGDGAADGAAE